MIEPLFIRDEELRQQMAPHVGKDRFAGAIKALEPEGFPKTISLFRGRYFPAVKAWLDEKYGVGSNGHLITAQDGPEQFDAAKGRRPRLQAKGMQPLLDRPPSSPRPDGLPRRLHPIAGGR
jgi:hypothetical protein